jgi:hypothetical protein
MHAIYDASKRKPGEAYTARDFIAASDGSNSSAYWSIGKLNTPRRLTPSVRVGAMRPISFRRRRGGPECVPTIQYKLHFHCVPGHDEIGEQAFVGDRLHLLLLLGLVAGCGFPLLASNPYL